MTSGFERLTDAQLRACYQARPNDLARLKALNEVLKRRNSDAAYDLQVEVVENINRLSRLIVTPIESHLRQLLQSRGLGRPDGRPLHRYALTDEEYRTTGDLLRKPDSIARMKAQAEDAARVFVLYSAEWFRREALSLFRRWEDVAPAVLGVITDNDKRALTLKGLQYWRRPLLRGTDDTREFLLTLAIEGGIPANVILDDTSTTLGNYLRMVLRAGLNDPTPEHIRHGGRSDTRASDHLPSRRFCGAVRGPVRAIGALAHSGAIRAGGDRFHRLSRQHLPRLARKPAHLCAGRA